MPLDGLDRMRGLARRAWKRRSDQPIVLLYHRVGEVTTDPQLLSVTPEHFAEHIRLVADEYEPIRLRDLVAANADGRALSRAVAITFDDGYVDNLLAAKPLLEQTGMPATVYVASGYVGGRHPFWWDELEQLLLQPGSLPSTLILEIEGERLRWELGDDADYTSALSAACAGWTVLDAQDPGPRQEIYRVLCDRLRVLDETERERVLDRLRSVAKSERADARMPRALTLEELARLAHGGLVEIGAHTISHQALSQLPPWRQRDEVSGSKRALEQVLGARISSFAYPYGAIGDFDETTIAIVREAGFDHACTSVPGRVNGRTDPFRLPRLVVRDWSADELECFLSATEQ